MQIKFYKYQKHKIYQLLINNNKVDKVQKYINTNISCGELELNINSYEESVEPSFTATIFTKYLLKSVTTLLIFFSSLNTGINT